MWIEVPTNVAIRRDSGDNTAVITLFHGLHMENSSELVVNVSFYWL